MKWMNIVVTAFLSIGLFSCVLPPPNEKITLIEKQQRVIDNNSLKLRLPTPQIIPKYYSAICVVLQSNPTIHITSENSLYYSKERGLKAKAFTSNGKNFDMDVFFSSTSSNGGVVYESELSVCAQTPKCDDSLRTEMIESFELTADKPVKAFGIYWETVPWIPDDCATAK
jgi:hypothetical protein